MKGDTFWVVFLGLLLVLCLVMCIWNRADCASKSCSAGKSPRIVDYKCLCVEVAK